MKNNDESVFLQAQDIVWDARLKIAALPIKNAIALEKIIEAIGEAENMAWEAARDARLEEQKALKIAEVV